MTKYWERRHANGWIASVSPHSVPALGFSYHARRTDVPDVRWTHTSDDLGLAQEAADALVPEHQCQCGDWVERAGTPDAGAATE
jgi:lysozyme family protein